MELVLTGAACRGAHAPLNRRSLPTREANGPDFPLSGSSTRRRLLDDTTAIVACQKFGSFVTTSQQKDHAKGVAHINELRSLDSDEHGIAYGPPQANGYCQISIDRRIVRQLHD